MVVADISGSVASFARFTLMFVYAMASQFSKVRSWVFIDGIDEVTRFFQESDDVIEAVHRVNTEADVVWVDGHSDYGHAFEVFYQRHYHEVTPKTSIILLGDARNNYHASQAWVVDELRKRGRHVYWLEPGAARLLGHRRLDRLRVRQVLRRRVRVPQPPPAPAVRHDRRRRLTAQPSSHRASRVEERPGPVGDPGERDELRALASPERMSVAADEQRRVVRGERRDREVVGAGRAVGDARRRGGAGLQRLEHAGVRYGARRRMRARVPS